MVTRHFDVVGACRRIDVSDTDEKLLNENPNAAPGALEVVRKFINSHDIEAGRDELAEADSARRWFSEHGLLLTAHEPSSDELQRLRRVREALRQLIIDDPEPGEVRRAVEVLNEAAARAALVVHFSATDVELIARGEGTEQFLAKCFAVVRDAVIEGHWSRLKACRSDACRWAFYDRSRNRSGVWCHMELCGSRAKMKAYRRRRTGRGDSKEGTEG